MAHDKNYNLNACPTCGQAQYELAPGIWEWTPSIYFLDGSSHPCQCEWQSRLLHHYLLAEIPSSYWTLSEDDFFGDSDALEAMQDYLDRWKDWKTHGIGLAFHSSTQGTGKTMLATIIARHLIHQGERVYFISFRDAVRLYDMPFEQREEKVRRLRNTPVLILDEVGLAISDAQHDFYSVELEDLIRFRTSGNAVTLITTNLTPAALDTEYPRIFSLLASKQRHITVGGHDVRRAGEVDLFRMELIANGEAQPIV